MFNFNFSNFGCFVIFLDFSSFHCGYSRLNNWYATFTWQLYFLEEKKSINNKNKNHYQTFTACIIIFYTVKENNNNYLKNKNYWLNF